MKQLPTLVCVVFLGSNVALAAPPATARVSTDRPFLQLGEEAERWLTVEFADASVPPRVTTSAGSIDGIEQTGPGAYRARFIAPTAPYPQIAIIAATFDEPAGPVHGWLVLPLWGQGLAVARTRPNAVISVTVGEMTFGPERADARGIARVPVRVPPGIVEAHDGTKPISLNLPPVAHHHVVIGARDLAADQAEETTVRVYAVTPTGLPRAGAEITIQAERGALGPPTRVAPGAYEATWRLEPRAVGTERVTATLTDQPDLASVATVEALAGKPATIRVQANPSTWEAGAEGPVRVTATVVDAGDNPVAADVLWESDFGHFVPTDSDDLGQYAADLEIPDEIASRASITIGVHLERRPSVRAEGTISLLPAQPVRVESFPAGRVVADGRHPVSLSMRLEDRFGNPVSALTPKITTSAGEIQSIERDGDLVRYEYLPPHHIRPTSATLEISAGEANAQVDLPLTPTLATLVAGAKVGTQVGAGDVGPVFAGELSYWTMVAHEHIGVTMEVGYQRFDQEVTRPIAATSTDVGWTVLARAGWRRSPWRDLVLNAGLGGGMTRMVSRIRVAGEAEQTGVDSLGFVEVSGGPGWRLGPGSVFADISYRWHQRVNIDFLTGSLSTLLVSGGYRLDVF